MDRYLTLSNGIRCPRLGLGTYTPLEDPSGCLPVVLRTAILDIGFRHIDTAELYENEAVIGETLKSIDIDRSELFITTKIWPPSYKGSVLETLKRQLKELQLSYVDLYLMHSPMGFHYDPETKERVSDVDVSFVEVWKGLEECHALGLAKSIGVSNFNAEQLARLLKNCSVKPVMNQIESHPFNTNSKLIDFCLKQANVAVTAFSPFANPSTKRDILGERNVFHDPRLTKIGAKHGKSNAQIVLRWQLQRGICVIPKSTSIDRLRHNFDVWDFELDDEDMKQIEAMDEKLWVVKMASDPNLQQHPEYPYNR